MRYVWHALSSLEGDDAEWESSLFGVWNEEVLGRTWR